MKPQEGKGCPSAPLRRGPDGFKFLVQGTMLSVAPVSTKYLSFVNSSVNPFAPTRRKTLTHFRQFFTVFEYSPIGVKFPLITAPQTLYTVKKKNWKIFKTF
jgi:hypothetical protein